jgi:hypothetical protein
MSSTNRIRALAAFFAVTTGALLFAGGPAFAADSARADSGDEVCWSEPQNGDLQCFADEAALSEAVFEQTGTILVDEESSFASRSSAGLLATYVLARLYEDPSYGGSTYVVWSSSSTTCNGGSKWENIAAAFNDRVSSFRSYFSCTTRIYEDANLGGSWFGYSINAPGVGALDNEASSVKVQ